MTLSITGLDERISRLEVQQLLQPTSNELRTLSQTITAQWNSISNSDTSQDDKLTLLTQGFSALKGSLNDLDALFVAHTGNATVHN
jgi:uncharacterized coiled-coil protein SlyX